MSPLRRGTIGGLRQSVNPLPQKARRPPCHGGQRKELPHRCDARNDGRKKMAVQSPPGRGKGSQALGWIVRRERTHPGAARPLSLGTTSPERRFASETPAEFVRSWHWERPFLTETLGLWAKYIAILFEVPKQFRRSCCGYSHEFTESASQGMDSASFKTRPRVPSIFKLSKCAMVGATSKL